MKILFFFVLLLKATVNFLQTGHSGVQTLVAARFSIPIQTSTKAHPTCCAAGNGSSSWGKSSWGMMLTTHPVPMPRLCMNRVIPLPTLYVFMACYNVTFTFVCKWYTLTPVTRHPKISTPDSVQWHHKYTVHCHAVISKTTSLLWITALNLIYCMLKKWNYFINNIQPYSPVVAVTAVDILNSMQHHTGRLVKQIRITAHYIHVTNKWKTSGRQI